ncbi:MAG TPA: hypothetical protein VIQ31_05790, partial [Phormidium sp.]
GVLCEPTDILYLLEMLLSFYAWYKHGHPFLLDNRETKEETKEAIRILLRSIKELVPRNCGNGWKLQKFHEILHLVDDMELFGSPLNWDASPGEHSLIDFAKRPAKRSQKSKRDFLQQVNTRIQESAIITKAYLSIDQPYEKICESNKNISEDEGKKINQNEMNHLLGSKFTLTVTLHVDNVSTTVVWEGKDHLQDTVSLNKNVIDWFQCNHAKIGLLSDVPNKVTIFTEYKTKGIVYRAHPNYRSDGPWYDWAMIKCGSVKGNQDCNNPNTHKGFWPISYKPAKVYCFFKLPNFPNKILALVHKSLSNDHDNDSILLERWQMYYSVRVMDNQIKTISPKLELVNVDKFIEPVLVVEDKICYKSNDIDTYQAVTVVLPFGRDWAAKFLSND